MRAWLSPLRALTALILTVFAFWSMAQDVQGDHFIAQHAQEIKSGLKQIHSQLVRLRQVTVQADQTQMGQSQAIQKQIEGIALSHSRLVEQLMELQADSQQQIEHLQLTNQRLKWTLGAVAGLALLIVLLFALKYPWTKTLPLAGAQAPAKQSPPRESDSVSSIAQGDQAAGLREIFATTTPSTDTNVAATPVTKVESPSEFESPSEVHEPKVSYPTTETVQSFNYAPNATWTALVTSDLNSMEQALSQARKGFMQKVIIK